MNANELAKELESVPAYRNTPMFQRAATMLRQQQEQIELLNAKLAYMFEQELKTARLNK